MFVNIVFKGNYMKKILLMLIMTPIYSYAIDNNTITATGKSSTTVKQTQGTVVFGVSETNKDPKIAQDTVRKKSDILLTSIKKLNTLNIATTSISINPVWSYKDNSSKITGYTSTYTLTVTANISQIGIVIDKAVENGADTVSSPQFSASDKDRESAEILTIKKATLDAKNKADASLNSLNIKTGKIKQITIQNINQPTTPIYNKFSTMRASNVNDNTPNTEISAGNDIVSSEVNIIMDY